MGPPIESNYHSIRVIDSFYINQEINQDPNEINMIKFLFLAVAIFAIASVSMPTTDHKKKSY